MKTPYAEQAKQALGDKLIIENRANMSMVEAIERCKCIVESGRVSGQGDKAQYCYYSVFNDGIAVAAFKNKHSDRLVVTETMTRILEEGGYE